MNDFISKYFNKLYFGMIFKKDVLVLCTMKYLLLGLDNGNGCTYLISNNSEQSFNVKCIVHKINHFQCNDLQIFFYQNH